MSLKSIVPPPLSGLVTDVFVIAEFLNFRILFKKVEVRNAGHRVSSVDRNGGNAFRIVLILRG